jgi:SAM-dependent methyltransferase
VRSTPKPDPSPSTPLQRTYDTIAAEYAKRIYDELKGKPLDRELLERFADRLRGQGLVCDLGCGPGQIGRYLCDRGCNVVGLDLSHGMLLQAAKLNADIRFVQGSMLAMPFATNSLSGIAAFYSIIHIPGSEVVSALSEFRRVLQPGGCVLLSFHRGEGAIRETEVWGYDVNFEAVLFTSAEMCGYIGTAGLRVEQVTERDPYPPGVEDQTRRAYILAVKH